MITRFFKRIFKIIYSFIKKFHLRLLFSFLIFSCIYQIITGQLFENVITLTVFATLFCILTVRIILIYINKLDKKLFENKAKHIIKDKQSNIIGQEFKSNNQIDKTGDDKTEEVANYKNIDEIRHKKNKENYSAIKPVYYRVSQNPKYIMAEYIDRYELYYEDEENLKYIRTDYKNN